MVAKARNFEQREGKQYQRHTTKYLFPNEAEPNFPTLVSIVAIVDILH